MAKPFYSMEEVCQLLKKDAEQIRAMVRDGALREFRDAGKVFFKADDVDKLSGRATAKGDSGEIMLESLESEPSAASDELPSLSDTPLSDSGMISLEPLDDEPKPKNKKEGTVISASGIGVFDDDELEIDADPMAKTHITTGPGDQVSLEGSGLLDLQRESDDTSLGAELLDEIYPGEEDASPAQRTGITAAAAAQPEEPEPEPMPVTSAPEPVAMTPSYAMAGDPNEGMFGGLLIGGVALLAVTGSVVAAQYQGFVPEYARLLSNYFWFTLGGAALVLIVSLGLGWMLGRMAAR